MSETSGVTQDEKNAITKRRPERESALTPTFTTAWHSPRSPHSPSIPTPSLLQRQCRCGQYTVAGTVCSTCQQQQTSFATRVSDPPAAAALTHDPPSPGFNLSTIPARTHPRIQANLIVNAPGDTYEQEADRVANTVMAMSETSLAAPFTGVTGVNQATVHRFPLISTIQASHDQQAFPASADVEANIQQMQGSGQPLPDSERGFFEARMGYDFGDVRIHTGTQAIQASRDIQAHAFTLGHNIAFNQGTYQPGTQTGRRLLAHELTHVVQQTGEARRKFIQRTIDPRYEATHGEFFVTARPQNAPAGSTRASLPITIRFQPKTTAPYSNQIGLIQIVRDINSDTGDNVEPQSLPAARAARLRTTADASTGVEGGFFTDVLHNDAPAHGGTGTDAPAGSALPPQYPFGNDPAQPNPATPGLSRPFSSGAGGATVGYKRSDAPADIKAAELTDAPGSSGNRNFNFETVAKGEDTMTIFGALKWEFQIRAGRIQNEQASVSDAQSATFDAALSRHRDFYVHEPVIFYFDFDNR
ncbi:MAG: DUF4157 domain-containing protein [Chloroflexi bacterium]|nr:DUF4157 domain-containing protein [Chloroflexota bacterium]MBP8059341.1 DUF4157 domain-containing protein [Chloroflexota bacterium]